LYGENIFLEKIFVWRKYFSGENICMEKIFVWKKYPGINTRFS